jgi:hypothetical protein
MKLLNITAISDIAFVPPGYINAHSDITEGKVKVKVKLSLCFFLNEHQVMKAYWGSGGRALHIL